MILKIAHKRKGGCRYNLKKYLCFFPLAHKIILGWCTICSDYVSGVGIPVAMGLFIDCNFLFKVQLLCLNLHDEVCHLKRVSGAADARKWNAKWRNLNIPYIFFYLSSIKGRKQQRRPETFAPCMGTMPSERARQENGVLVLMRIVLTLVIPHVQEDIRNLMKIL